MIMKLLSGFPPEKLQEYNMTFEGLPPWMCTWMALYMDMLCTPLQCRHSWRSYLPFGLAEPGHWFSEEFETIGIVDKMPDVLTFEEFRAQQGYNVTESSSAFAGVQSFEELLSWKDYWSSVYEYMFHTPSTAFSCLWTCTSLWTILALVMFIKAIKAIVLPRFQKWGRRLAMQAHGEAWIISNEERIVKFGEYVFRLCYHSLISLVGLYYFWDAPWWNEDLGGTQNLFTNYPDDPVAPGMSWYYLFQGAYNVDAFISLLQISFDVKIFPKHSIMPFSVHWAKTVRGDFNEMVAHHIVTNALVFLSSFFRQTRVGSMVFWMHDLSDVPVDLAKLANFVKWKTATEVAFGLLCFMWVFTRLYIFPFKIWSAIYSESYELMSGNLIPACYYYTYLPCFLILLGILILLHFLWFSMFIKMGYLLYFKGQAHDMTEHKEGEKDNLTTYHLKKTKANGAVTTNGHGKAKAH